jgi:hypothetical protein
MSENPSIGSGLHHVEIRTISLGSRLELLPTPVDQPLLPCHTFPDELLPAHQRCIDNLSPHRNHNENLQAANYHTDNVVHTERMLKQQYLETPKEVLSPTEANKCHAAQLEHVPARDIDSQSPQSAQNERAGEELQCILWDQGNIISGYDKANIHSMPDILASENRHQRALVALNNEVVHLKHRLQAQQV